MNKVGLLVQKDLIYLCTSLKKLVFMAIVFSFVFPISNITLAFAIPSMIGYLLTYGIFSYEEKNKMHLLNASLPVDRKALCASKYVTGMIYTLASCLVILLGAILGYKFLGTNDAMNALPFIINAMCTILAITLIYNSIILPVMLYFGAIKMKYIMFLLYFMSFAILGALGSSNNRQQAQTFMQDVLTHTSSLTILVGSIIIYIISYIISISLYAHKEFK